MSHAPTDLIAGMIVVATAAVVFWRFMIQVFVIITITLLLVGVLHVFQMAGLEIHHVDGRVVSSK